MRHTVRPLIAIYAATVMLAAACNSKDKAMNQLPEISSKVQKQLAFTCVHEADHIPPRDPEAEQLYKHARWLVKANILKQDPTSYPAIERLLRIATAYGHDKANIELRGMLEKSQASSADPVNEIIDLVQELIHRGIPAGYYDMGWYLEHGYGMRADPELGFKYYRKSADMGSPEGQYLVGMKLADKSKYGAEIAAIGNAMRRCAADQGHAEGAFRFSIRQHNDGKFLDAMKYLQIAVAYGDAAAAQSMAEAFGSQFHADEMYSLGQPVDTERYERYNKISKFLTDYEYLNPKVLEIDTILPLPPAKLPAWDGKLQWLEAHKANVPPSLPTEERIAEMARAKGLDPKTGRALGGK